MVWKDKYPSYYEEYTRTLYVCMDCILLQQDCEISDPDLKIKRIIFDSQKDTDFTMVQEKINKASIPTIDEFETYNPPGTPRIYRASEASFRITLTNDNQISYIPPKHHSHILLLRQLKST